MDKPRILFVSPTATDATDATEAGDGAARVLVDVAAELARRGAIVRFLVVQRSGPLAAAMRALGDVLVLEAAGVEPLSDDAVDMTLAWFDAFRPTAVVYGSLRTGNVAAVLGPRRDVRSIVHVHELDGAAAPLQAAFPGLLSFADTYVGASAAVARMLSERMQVPAAKLVEHRPALDLARLERARREPLALHRGLARARARGQRIIGGIGPCSSAMGTDLFVDVARELVTRRDDVTFAWFGPDPRTRGFEGDPEFGRRLAERLDETGFGSRLVFVSACANLYPQLEAIDLFFSPAREDGSGLGVLEAMWLGKPGVVFDGGGVRELVGDDAGTVVPYLELDAATAAIERLVDDARSRTVLGAVAARKIREAHDIAGLVDAIAPGLGFDPVASAREPKPGWNPAVRSGPYRSGDAAR